MNQATADQSEPSQEECTQFAAAAIVDPKLTFHSPRPASSRVFRIFVFFAFAFATLQFLRAYFIVNQPYLDAARYEAGTEKTPYQSRVLMAMIMRHARRNPVMEHIASRLGPPLHEPDVVVLLSVGLLSMVLIAVVVRAFYRHIFPCGHLSSMPYFLVLWMASATYIVRFQEAIYFPYDLLAAALFTLCIYLCYRRSYLLLVPVFAVACFNRETIVMIIPLVLINYLFPVDGGSPNASRWKEIVVAAVMLAIWAPVYLHLKHMYAGNPTDLGFHNNLHFLFSPQIWPQILSACGFLIPVPLLFWRLIPNRRLRFYTLLIPTWIVIMSLVGLLPESRIFGELIGLLAVLCTVLFEQSIKSSEMA